MKPRRKGHVITDKPAHDQLEHLRSAGLGQFRVYRSPKTPYIQGFTYIYIYIYIYTYIYIYIYIYIGMM